MQIGDLGKSTHSCEYGYIEPIGKHSYTSNVVAVFVSYEYRRDFAWINASCNERIDRLCDSETTVYKDSGLTVANNGAISLAPASQGSKLQSEPSKLLRFGCAESLDYVFTQNG